MTSAGRAGRSGRWLAAGLAAALLSLTACASAVRPAPLEASIERAFANLYVLQQAEQGRRISASSLHARASCQKGTQATAQHGPGNDWVCQITFLVAGPATPVTALYAVNAQSNGCYAAEGDGPATLNGSRTITGATGRARVNPLALIDGCFNPG